LATTRTAINAHIISELGAKIVGELTAAEIKAWHRKLAASAARLRSKKDATTPNVRKIEGDDAKRRRKSSANRILTILKAVLNHAWREGKVASPDAWAKVKPFPEVDAPRVRYLTPEECLRLANACPADFRQLVRAALHTGARYGELAALRADDFSADSGTIHVRRSKSGRARHIILTEAGKKFFEQATNGKVGAASIFTKDGLVWGKSHQHRPIKEACAAAKITPAISFHILRHTYASQAVMAGIPLMVVAENLGHSDTRMVERHYGHLAESYKAKLIRDRMPALGGEDKSEGESEEAA
jgi:integrase